MVEPTENLRLADGMAVGQSLVGAREELVTVLVANFSDKACKIRAGAKLGTCQLARSLGHLDQYNYHIVHYPGRVHSNADSLSRRLCEPGCSHCAQKDSDVVCLHLQVLAGAAEGSER